MISHRHLCCSGGSTDNLREPWRDTLCEFSYQCSLVGMHIRVFFILTAHRFTMEYVQERVTTLHALRNRTPEAPTDRTAVVVPMTEREYGALATEQILSELEVVDPARVVVPLRAPRDRVGTFCDWLAGYDLTIEVVWCDGPQLATLLRVNGLDGQRGKGRDVWLALGRALEEEYVVFHDADTASYSRRYVPKLLFPLAHGNSFSKGYYARVENGRLYGRLFRLFYAPFVRAIQDVYDTPVVDYLGAFRYALAGEFAATSELASTFRFQRNWGLEVGTLGEAHRVVGFAGSAQVDLGQYEHDHRAVSGPTGLSEMSESVATAILQVLVDHGIDPRPDALIDRYTEVAESLIDSYRLDALYNGLDIDTEDEREQVSTYAGAIEPLGGDNRLPAWSHAPITSDEVAQAAQADLRALDSDRTAEKSGEIVPDHQHSPNSSDVDPD